MLVSPQTRKDIEKKQLMRLQCDRLSNQDYDEEFEEETSHMRLLRGLDNDNYCEPLHSHRTDYTIGVDNYQNIEYQDDPIFSI